MAALKDRRIYLAVALVFSLIANAYTKAIINKRSVKEHTRYTVHEKPPELVVNASPEGVKVQAKPSKLQVIAYPHLQPYHPFEHTAVLGPHSPPVNIGPNAPPVHIAAHVPAVHLSPRVPSLHFGTNAPLLHVRPHVPFVHMTPPLPAINAVTGPPVHVMSPSTVYHQSPIVFHQPHFAYPGFGYGGGYYGRSHIPRGKDDQDKKYNGKKSKRFYIPFPNQYKRQFYGWHPFPHSVNVGPHTPPIHVGPHYPPVHIGPHVPAVHIGPHVPVINVPSHVPAIHVRPHVPAVHLGPPVPIINAGNHFPAVHVSSPPTIYHRPPIVIHQPHIIHPYGSWRKKKSGIPKAQKQEEVRQQNDEADVSGSGSGDSADSQPENENQQETPDRKISLRSEVEGNRKLIKRQMFSNANSGPNGDSVIFVHPSNSHTPGGDNAGGLPSMGNSHSNPLEGAGEFGDMSSKAFGDSPSFSPSFGDSNGGQELPGGVSDSISNLAGGGSDPGGLGGLGGENSNLNIGGFGSLGGGQEAPETDLAGNLGGGGLGSSFTGGSLGGGLAGSLGGGSLGSLGGGSMGSLGGGLGGGLTSLGNEQEARSKVLKNKFRSFIPGSKRLVTQGYLKRVPLDDGRNAEIVKKTTIPRAPHN